MLGDLRSGLRQIGRNRAFAAAVVLTLALSVGAITAVFSLADPMLFRPLPYLEADRLVDFRVSGKGVIGGRFGVHDYLAIETETRAFESVANFDTSVLGYLPGTTEPVMAYAVTPGFMRTLRVQPVLGRSFLPEEHQPRESGPAVALITSDLAVPGSVRRAGATEQDLRVTEYPVSGGFFDVFGLTLVRGRWFDEREAFTNAPVAVVDELAAASLWPGEEALGQFIVGTGEDTQATIPAVCGVVAGAGAAFWSTRGLGAVLVELAPNDPVRSWPRLCA